MELNSLGLLALTLPTNLEQPALRLQHRLFTDAGLSSALALPPLIPLLWSNGPLPLEEVRRCALRLPISVRLEASSPLLAAGEVWLSTEIRGAGVSPEHLGVSEPGEDQPAGLFSLQPLVRLASAERLGEEVVGRYLEALGREGAADGRTGTRAEIGTSGRPEKGRRAEAVLESASITVTAFQIDFGAPRTWWRHVNYHRVAARRVPGR
mgnify:CR=1 FL=1